MREASGPEKLAQQRSQSSAIACLKTRLARYERVPIALKVQIQPYLETLGGLQQKLTQPLIQIAVFGLVSRGKSAVLNALFGETLFPTGLLNGVTQWPRSVRWSVAQASAVQLELIDTPGLDEVSGEARAAMAQEIARSADLILFVTAGPPLPSEQKALAELAQWAKPLLWVVNKADLYPGLSAEVLYASLPDGPLQTLLSVREIVLTAAAPAPVQVRHKWPDGSTSQDWESPPPQIQQLQKTLLDLLNREGLALLSLNVLLQAQAAERQIVAAIAQFYVKPVQAEQWRIWGAKAALIALSPWGALDLAIGMGTDIVQVRQLSKHQNLSATRHHIRTLWQTLLLSAGYLGFAEVGTSGLGGWGESFGGALMVAAITQGAVAAYGASLVGHAAQRYLLNGATWDAQGPSFLIQQLLDKLTPEMVLYRLSGVIAETLALVAEGPALIQPGE